MARNYPTLAEVRTEVRRHLDDPNAGVWSDAELNRNINRAIVKVWTNTEWESARTTFEGTAGTMAYSLPSGILLLKTVVATDWDAEKLFPTDFILMDKFDPEWEGEGASQPSRYLLFSHDKIYFWPPPNANDGDRTIALEYVPIPQTVSTDTGTTLGAVSTVPPLYLSELIILKATALSWLRQDWRKWLYYNQQYHEKLNRALSILRTTSATHTTKLRPAKKFEKAHGAVRFRLRY